MIQKIRKYFWIKAEIEPVTGHLKQDHRMWLNFLLDKDGDKLNSNFGSNRI